MSEYPWNEKNNTFTWLSSLCNPFKGTVMQIKKALINDCLRVSKVFWKFHIPTIYNIAVIYLWNLLFSQIVAYFLTVSIVFTLYKQISMAKELKN